MTLDRRIAELEAERQVSSALREQLEEAAIWRAVWVLAAVAGWTVAAWAVLS